MKNKKQLLFLLLPGITLLTVFLLLVIFEISYFHKIYPRIYIGQTKVGGLTSDEAKSLLVSKTSKINNIYISHNNQVIILPLVSIKAEFLIDKSVKNAYSYGRSQNLSMAIASQLKLLPTKPNLPLKLTFDQNLLREKVASVSAEVEIPAIPAEIFIANAPNGKQIGVNSGQDGQTIDWKQVNKNITDELSSLKEPNFILPVQVIKTAPSEAQINQVKQLGTPYLNKQIDFTTEEEKWTLTDKEIIGFLTFDGFSDDKISSYSSVLTTTIKRPAENALFAYDGQMVRQFKPAQTGLELDQKQTTILIQQALEKIKDSQEKLTISLPLNITQPEITTADSNNFGINGLIGQGESWFSHSITPRIHNVDLASSKFHGILLPPGEIFSFNQNLGEVSSANGYQPAYIIKDGRTILGDGGGVCQVSTTIFRAALQSGLEIIERTPHAYRVSYYEQNSPAGMDATVFSPSPDLKFKNNTAHHILIQRVINTNTQYLAFNFYGHKDNRTVYISKPKIWGQTPPPPDLYQDDPTLPINTIKQVDWAAWGAKTSFIYKVSIDGQILQEKTFYSNYRPWQAIYLRGTKID